MGLSKVYIKVDDQNRIICCDGGYTLKNIGNGSEWILIDEGAGDRYNLCQGNYFPQPIIDERGIYRYKLVDGKPVERTQEEMDADYTPTEIKPTTEQRVELLETTTDDIILMMAELIGG